MGPLRLFAVPNVSEGEDPETLGAVGDAFARAGAEVLDLHADADHGRAVFWLAGEPGRLAPAVAAGAREAAERISLERNVGVHPHVGATDVAPVVFSSPAERGAACAEALLLGDLLGRAGLPVFLYGALAGGRARAELRAGGRAGLAARVAAGELLPDFGGPGLHPTAGATLVAARPPLVAFNVVLGDEATLADARRIAAEIREGGPAGLPGLRALGLPLARQGRVQVSTNVEDHRATSLAEVVAAVRARAPVSHAELVGLAPEAAWAGFPADVPVPAFDPGRHLLERRLEPGASGQRRPAGARPEGA